TGSHETGRGVSWGSPVAKTLVGEFLEPALRRTRGPAAEFPAPAAQDAAAPDIVILVNDDDGGTVIARRDGGRQSGNPRPDHDDVRRPVPIALRSTLRHGLLRSPYQGDAGGARRQKHAPAHLARRRSAAIRRVLVHCFPPGSVQKQAIAVSPRHSPSPRLLGKETRCVADVVAMGSKLLILTLRVAGSRQHLSIGGPTFESRHA